MLSFEYPGSYSRVKHILSERKTDNHLLALRHEKGGKKLCKESIFTPSPLPSTPLPTQCSNVVNIWHLIAFCYCSQTVKTKVAETLSSWCWAAAGDLSKGFWGILLWKILKPDTKSTWPRGCLVNNTGLRSSSSASFSALPPRHQTPAPEAAAPSRLALCASAPPHSPPPCPWPWWPCPWDPVALEPRPWPSVPAPTEPSAVWPSPARM